MLNDPLRDPGLAKQIHLSGGKKTHLGAFVDFSFFVLDENGAPVLQVECDTSYCTAPLRCREAPILMVPFHAEAETIRLAVKLALDQLLWIASWVGTRGIQIELDSNTEVGRAAAPIIRPLISYVRPMVRGAVTLSRDMNDIVSSYSENHRRSIRKGLKCLDVYRFHHEDPRAVQCYDDLHAKIGRVRALDRELLVELLGGGSYSLYGAYRDGEPVGVVGISRHGNTAYYSAGIMSGPDNVPVGHAMMHRAIEDAKADGLDRFDFGLLDVAEGSDPKMKSIARFKLGFCNDVHERLVVDLTF